MFRYTNYLPFFIVALMSFSAVFSQPEKLLMEKHNIRVYELANETNKNHMKSEFYVHASRNNTADEVLQTTNYKKWVNNIKKLYPIEKGTDSVFYCRAVVGVKSIFMKEGIIKVTVNATENTAIELNLIKDYKYDFKYDKLKRFHARWVLSSMGDEYTKVQLIYQGGRDKYPDLVNRFLDKILMKKIYRLSWGLKKHLEKMQ